MILLRTAAVVAALAVVALGPPLDARRQAGVAPSLLSDLVWRPLGPSFGGEATVAAGVPDAPAVFYVGTANGGLWTTSDAGQSWQPLFDREGIGAIGALSIAPSNARVIYVGTGVVAQRGRVVPGDGLYRSDDGGRTWRRLGLTASAYITSVAVATADPNRLVVAALGSASVSGGERGLYRSTDGGRSFTRVMATGPDIGAVDLVGDPSDTGVLYAALWQFAAEPWSGRLVSGPETSLVKSVDGGATWSTIRGPDALPAGKTSVAVAPGDPGRVFLLQRTDDGVARWFTSEDGGGSWTSRPLPVDVAAGYPRRVFTARDEAGRTVVVLAGDGLWRSRDLGVSFERWRDGVAAMPDAYVWVNPRDSAVAIVAGAQGASVTLNDGASWSRTDTLPLSRLARVTLDTVFPYHACAVDPVAGPGCLPLRGDSGAITAADWRRVGNGVNGFVAPDPTDADIVFSGAVSRFDRRTGQLQAVTPVVAGGPEPAAAPLVFAPAETRSLFFAPGTLWKSTNGGASWSTTGNGFIRVRSGRPPFQGPTAGRDVSTSITAVAPSPVDARVIWVGLDDGAIHVTRDGGLSWREVTPAGIAPWSRVAAIEPSHFDSNTAYVAVDLVSLGPPMARLLRTRDGGATWTPIVSGLPLDAASHSVREDQLRRGLLFAGTARSVFVSFDDGDDWQPLRLNLPPVDVRDLAVRESTLVAATDGRGLWALDDLAVLRQVTPDLARTSAFLYRPAVAWRLGQRVGSDMTSAISPNPPDGVALAYQIGAGGQGPVTLEIIETASGDVIRRFASDDPRTALAAGPGVHHVIWDLRYTPVGDRAPLVAPGAYQVRLTVGDLVLRQAVLVRLDPRVRTPLADLAGLVKQGRTINAKRSELVTAMARTTEAARLDDLKRALDRLDRLFDLLQEADARPTSVVDAAIAAALDEATQAIVPLP